jgi:hypothetical protein
MSTLELLSTIKQAGLELFLEGERLRYRATQQPDEGLLALIREHKPLLIETLRQRHYLPKIPWQLERLISAATNTLLSFNYPGVPNLNSYVMAWACGYLIGDREESLKRLWAVYRAWQEVLN